MPSTSALLTTGATSSRSHATFTTSLFPLIISSLNVTMSATSTGLASAIPLLSRRELNKHNQPVWTIRLKSVYNHMWCQHYRVIVATDYGQKYSENPRLRTVCNIEKGLLGTSPFGHIKTKRLHYYTVTKGKPVSASLLKHYPD